ncbi:MAG: hypothetical protein HKO93_02020, partial [Flavobacteriales bacterium]|nr:hypothetical protein [Flavobacteriales bacterium]
KVKIYTISKDISFEQEASVSAALERLPEWLAMKNSFNADHASVAFLIVHSGNEGVFSIINWWVGDNMLNTYIFFSPKDNSEKFELISGDGLSPCIWELEVIDFERKLWIEHILKRQDSPEIEAYLAKSYNGSV